MQQEIAIPTLDMSSDSGRQVVVAAGTESVYQGQVNTVLMSDGMTIYAVWSIPHGGWCGSMKKSLDCGYSGLECLPDGTFVATTYVKYRTGPELNSIVSVRFCLEETDRMI